MAPKKKRGRSPTQARPTGEAPAVPRSVSRTPLVVEDRRRWPAAVWILLACAWLAGSPLFFVLYLAEGFAMLDTGEVTDAARRAAAWYLVWMLVFALLVPLGGAVAALWLRRRVAAAMFAAALALSAVVVFSLASPAELLGGIAGAFG
ncbi:hypothetical protein GCM10022205_29660 [Spinactinospora alkalitolerans]